MTLCVYDVVFSRTSLKGRRMFSFPPLHFWQKKKCPVFNGADKFFEKLAGAVFANEWSFVLSCRISLNSSFKILRGCKISYLFGEGSFPTFPVFLPKQVVLLNAFFLFDRCITLIFRTSRSARCSSTCRLLA